MVDSTTTKATKKYLCGVVDLTPSFHSIGVARDRSGVFPVPLWRARTVLLEVLTHKAEGFFRERAWEGGPSKDDSSTGCSGETAEVFFLRLEVRTKRAYTWALLLRHKV